MGSDRLRFAAKVTLAGLGAFVASWILFGVVWDAIVTPHPHMVVPTAAITGLLALPAGAVAGAVAGALAAARPLRARVAARALALAWLGLTAALALWLLA